MKHYASLTRVVPGAVFRRDRMLPTRGKILVSIGDRVDSVDIIGRYEMPGRLLALNARSALHLKGRDLSGYMQKRPGDIVKQGDIVASKPRLDKWFPRTLRSPVAGRIVAATDSQIIFESEVREAEVRAHLTGRVVSVMPERGAVIETTSALVQCTLGVGGLSHGVIRAAVESPEDALTEGRVDVSCLGAIVLGGSGATKDALVQLGKMQAQGLILGSLTSDLLEYAASLPFPVLLTEGIGHYSMNQKAFDLLVKHIGSEAGVDPGDSNPWGPRRPEILIPLPASDALPADVLPETLLKEGISVRIVRGENGGVTGTIIGIPEHPIYHDIGVSLPSVEIQTDLGDRVFAPVSGVEVLG